MIGALIGNVHSLPVLADNKIPPLKFFLYLDGFCFFFRFVIIVCLQRLLGYSSSTFSAKLTACHCNLARHIKTDPAETVAFRFGYRVFEPIDTVETG
jgi:hypothetical protein